MYNKKTWVNLPDESTYITTEDMNRIENGIELNETNVGDLSSLTTTNKNNVVNAINEVKEKINTSITEINNDFTGKLTNKLDVNKLQLVSHIINVSSLSNIVEVNLGIIDYGKKPHTILATQVGGFAAQDLIFNVNLDESVNDLVKIFISRINGNLDIGVIRLNMICFYD